MDHVGASEKVGLGGSKLVSSKMSLMKIEKNTVVSIIYRLTDAQDNLIEESSEPMVYLHGGYAGTFPKIEEILESQEEGFETQVQLEPTDAFGEYDADLLRIENRDLFPEPLEVGMQFEGMPSTDDADAESIEFVDSDEDDLDSLIYTVTDIAQDRIVLDANHPLAGIALRFWLQVASIRAATSEEVENGRADNQIGLQVDQFEEDEDENLDDLLPPDADHQRTLH